MFCGKCGTQVTENQMFCSNCGGKLHIKDNNGVQNESVVPQNEQDQNSVQMEQYMQTSIPSAQSEMEKAKYATKLTRIGGIVMLAIGALISIYNIDTVEYDWSFLAVCTGILLQVRGILQICKVKMKPTGITTLSLASVLLSFTFLTELSYDWELCGFFVALVFIAVSILELLKKTYMLIGIVQLSGGSMLSILGCATLDYVWGDMTLGAGISLVVSGILFLVNYKKMGAAQ